MYKALAYVMLFASKMSHVVVAGAQLLHNSRYILYIHMDSLTQRKMKLVVDLLVSDAGNPYKAFRIQTREKCTQSKLNTKPETQLYNYNES